jgi:tRNA(Ile)-lysidine synthase
LLAVSGGVDSIVLCHLFSQAKFKFAIAHCNFMLRSKESDEDEQFVKALADKYSVPFHSISFETKKFAKKKKYSTQEAARELRYNWFHDLMLHYNYSAIVTAHHSDDSIETFFINLLRGTGIRGLRGILPKQNQIIRPLLFASKNEILLYAKKNKIVYREDSSNQSDDYTRNKIRNKLIPLLAEINSSANENILKTIGHLRLTEQIYTETIESKYKQVVIKENETVKFSIRKLKKLEPLATYLFEFLYHFNFSEYTINNLMASLDSESGKLFYSETHRIIKDREFLVLNRIEPNNNCNIKIAKSKNYVEYKNLQIQFRLIKNDATFELNKSSNVAQLDYDKLTFPLILRHWEPGDTFQPLGMKGKKKLSDYFIDKKYSINKKEQALVLVSNNQIVWLVGDRIDERFKVRAITQKIYFAELKS